MDVFDGVICDNTVAIRRLAFHKSSPLSLFDGMPLYILPFDDTTVGVDILDEKKNYGFVANTEKLDPGKSWAFPIVTGHKYRIHWATTGLDFEKMSLEMSEHWEETDKNVYFVQNFTDTRV